MPIPLISTEELRRRLAGMADPEKPSGATEGEEVKQAVHRFGCVLAHLFGESLDRTTLWERIASGLAAACAKVDDGDLDRFASLCLDHVKADHARAAACDALGDMIATFAVRPVEWRQAFVRYVRTHPYTCLVHSRARWEIVKSKGGDL